MAVVTVGYRNKRVNVVAELDVSLNGQSLLDVGREFLRTSRARDDRAGFDVGGGTRWGQGGDDQGCSGGSSGVSDVSNGAGEPDRRACRAGGQ